MELVKDSAECGVRRAECTAFNWLYLPHSECRAPHCVAGIGAALILLALVVILCVPAAVMACPLCKESLFDPSQLHQKLSMARGYALSIGLLLAVPLGLVVGVTTLIARAQRHARVRHAACGVRHDKR